jgi:MOSC domain-containing protein YiiM
VKITGAFKLAGRVSGLFRTMPEQAETGFVTTAVDALPLTFEGIVGDRHGGYTRHSGGREPWYPRGTQMRNERQVSILSPVELEEIAAGLGVAHVHPEWIGGNITLSGVPHLSMLPPRTCLFFEGGVTLRIDGQNVPCRLSGRSVASHYPDRTGLDVAFVKVARRLRGLVAWTEKPGLIRFGESVEIRVPEQWTYTAPNV